MFSIFGITIHLYGLIVGIAVVAGLQLIEYRYKQIKQPLFSESQLWKSIFSALFFGILGARLWHIVTDWQLYQNNYLQTLYIWNGGISILGAVLGGAIGIVIAVYYFGFSQLSQPKKVVATFFDLTVFGLPFAQAIGRVGNFVNQELYGLPSNLPWAITIDPAYRAVGFEHFATFHPLFAYEAVITLVFGIIIWYLFKISSSVWFMKIGTGNLALLYLSYYSFTRFFLEFLRIDKTLFLETPFGLNQVILLVIGVAGFAFFTRSYIHYAITKQ